jgi:hypothetical protein
MRHPGSSRSLHVEMSSTESDRFRTVVPLSGTIATAIVDTGFPLRTTPALHFPLRLMYPGLAEIMLG